MKSLVQDVHLRVNKDSYLLTGENYEPDGTRSATAGWHWTSLQDFFRQFHSGKLLSLTQINIQNEDISKGEHR
jgi:hypothetical protein